MKITPAHQSQFENMLNAEAAKRGAADLVEWIALCRQSVTLGQIPAPRKSEAILFFSYLIKGELLNFICDTLYVYCNDDHVRTLQERIFRKHAR